jgi:hypothetical protein
MHFSDAAASTLSCKRSKSLSSTSSDLLGAPVDKLQKLLHMQEEMMYHTTSELKTLMSNLGLASEMSSSSR